MRPCSRASVRETKIQFSVVGTLGHADSAHVDVAGCDPRQTTLLPTRASGLESDRRSCAVCRNPRPVLTRALHPGQGHGCTVREEVENFVAQLGQALHQHVVNPEAGARRIRARMQAATDRTEGRIAMF